MIDLAFITPTCYLEKYSKQGDLYLALAHLIDDEGTNDYARFHRREADKGRRVILDNGLFEGAQVDTESLLRRARAINASVVCAPDILYDSAGTVKEFKAFIKAKQDFGLHAEVMGIPQASNPDDWWDCFRFMDLSSDCNIIGLSILSVPQSFENVAINSGLWPEARFERITHSRVYLFRQLLAYASLIDRPVTPCHMLGLGESYADIVYANRVLEGIVVSNDSSSCFIHGKHRVAYGQLGTIPGGKNHEKVDFGQEMDLQLNQKTCIQHNIEVAKSIAHSDWRPYYAR